MGYRWVGCSVVLVAVAQLLLKIGIVRFFESTPVSITAWESLDLSAINIPALLTVGSGLLCYLVSVVCWIRALESLPLNVSYPLLSLSYPLVYLGAMQIPFLHEVSNPSRVVGVVLIMIGVTLLSPAVRTKSQS